MTLVQSPTQKHGFDHPIELNDRKRVVYMKTQSSRRQSTGDPVLPPRLQLSAVVHCRTLIITITVVHVVNGQRSRNSLYRPQRRIRKRKA